MENNCTLLLSPAERYTSTMAFSWYRLCVCLCLCQVLSGPLTVSCWSFLWALTNYTHSRVHTHTHIACLWQYNIQGPLSTHPLQCRGKIGSVLEEHTQRFVTSKKWLQQLKPFDHSDFKWRVPTSVLVFFHIMQGLQTKFTNFNFHVCMTITVVTCYKQLFVCLHFFFIM